MLRAVIDNVACEVAGHGPRQIGQAVTEIIEVLSICTGGGRASWRD